MTGVTISTRASELTMPPSTGVASGFITSAPVEWLHMIGKRLATTVVTVITFGRSRSSAPSCHRLQERRPREAAAERLALPRHRFLQVDHHHHRRLHRRAEERDEADPDRDREVVAERVQQVDPAGEAEGDREQHLGGLEERAVGQVEQQIDHERARPGTTIGSRCRARTSFSYCPLHSMYEPVGSGDSLGDDLARLLDEAARRRAPGR